MMATAQSTITQPYAFMDLDDTLFQTERKLKMWGVDYKIEDLTVASVNKAGQPLGMMTNRQASFFKWLCYSTELIAVTARDTAEIMRVTLSFDSWQVLTHGAVIIQPDGTPLHAWQRQMHTALSPLQNKLTILINELNKQHIGQQDTSQFLITPHYETFLGHRFCVYLAIKHRHRDHEALIRAAWWLPKHIPQLDGNFYIHCNANNLAILPNVVHKQHAVRYLLDNKLDDDRPSFGFGDSLADLPFLQLLDWYGTPKQGQLHRHISEP